MSNESRKKTHNNNESNNINVHACNGVLKSR
jgi:hypothetical protein